MPITIRPLAPADHAQWLELAQAYQAFYQQRVSPAVFERTWQRLIARDHVHGLCAVQGDELVGIAHYLLHASPWSRDVCYLEDLYVRPGVRGHGVARRLIEAVAAAARQARAAHLYWTTHETNGPARTLYDKVGRNQGFIRYEYALTAGD